MSEKLYGLDTGEDETLDMLNEILDEQAPPKKENKKIADNQPVSKRKISNDEN